MAEQSTKGSVPNKSSSTMQMGVALMLLGSSAGLTMYTRRTGAMITRLNQYTKNSNQLKTFFGPPTRAEFEKMMRERAQH
mmetsp:Transcript_28567/g.43922  ORF Transcript_28567/g.43922 Transcript_28567/m.43922 type:complete len:80 (+) Transcript_28567:118-357(+)